MATKSKLNLNKSALVETPNSKASTEAPNNKASNVTQINKASNVNNNKVSPATPKIPKLGRGIVKSETDSPSPLQNSRLSIDRSPRSVPSKPSVDRRSPKLNTTPDKQPTRLSKGSELQVQLNLVQEDLKKAKEKLAEVEKEKDQAVDELKEAQRLAEEANGKLAEALVAQKRAEEESEIEKFRTVEMEQAGIDANQKKEEEWQTELENMQKQHALDIAALLSATQELQKVKQELVRTSDAKNQALSHADEATQIAEIHVEKVEILSAELARLKALLECRNTTEANNNDTIVLELKIDVETLKQELDRAKEFESEANNYSRMVMELTSEVETLKQDLQKADNYKEKLAETEVAVAQLNVELEMAKIAEACAQEKVKNYEVEASNYKNIVMELKSEVETLKQQLEKANDHEKKVLEIEAELEKLSVELEAARTAESYAHNLLEEWQKRVEELELHAEKANLLEKSASESLDSIMKQLEESNGSLHDAESEIASLKEKVGSLEISIGSQRGDLEISERSLNMAKEQASEMEKEVESLKCELDTLKGEKIQALNNEKLAAESVQTLLEEKSTLINELETFRIDEEKSKKAMESLASALHEASSEAREAKQKLISAEEEHENLKTQVENLKLVLRASNEKYESMLDDAKHEINVLTNSIQQTEHDQQTAMAEREQRELHLMDCINKSEEECSSMTKEVSRLVNALKEAEDEASATKEEEARLKNTLAEAESEMHFLKEVLGEAKAESMKLKESLMDKENELQSVVQENKELQNKESASLIKVKELSKLLEEGTTRKQAENNGELADSEKDYNLLPKVVEFSLHNGDQKEENTEAEIPHHEEPVKEIPLTERNVVDVKTVENGTETTDINEKPKVCESKEKDDDNSVEIESKIWESGKIEEKDFLEAAEKESVEEVDSKTENNSLDQINGLSSKEDTPTVHLENGGSSPPTKEQSHKKKKPLLHKFGSLLKKKSSSNPK
ncbi:WEB family protein At3g02930, chloroplastic-like isoform X1 [Daucus carota subsp. sativus]|uniref:WEB family protein At3g02930, chloroplastic-like isoform X1 n=1 Tax=Daucus carota subsp. sativus TaxID=79200 RepID=UPI003082F3FE